MIDLFLGSGLGGCALLAAVAFGGRQERPENLYLAGWLGSYAIFFLGWIAAPRLPGGGAFLLAAIASSSIMLPPVFLWFYARAASGAEVARRFPHFIPAAANFVLMLALAAFARAENIGGAITISLPPALTPLLSAPVIFLIAISAYPVLSIRTARARKLALLEARSDDGVNSLDWVKAWAASTILLHLALFVASIVSNTGAASLGAIMAIGAAAMAVQILFVSYKGLSSGAIRTGAGPAPRGGRSRSLAEPVSERLSAFRLHMEKEKPFLDPHLTVEALADQLGWPREDVTQAVRAEDANFFDCINRHRVEEAKRLMADPANRDISLLSIAFDAGFGSKSAFNAAFRARVGMTPSQFKAEHAPC